MLSESLRDDSGIFSLFLRTKDQLIASNMSIIMFIIFHFCLHIDVLSGSKPGFLIIRDRKRDELYAVNLKLDSGTFGNINFL